MTRLINILRVVFLASTFAALIAVLGVAYLFFHYSSDLPDIQSVKDYDPPQINRIYSADGKILSEFGEERRMLVSHEQIPVLLLNAFVAAEDAAFYQHEGFDFLGITRAIISNVIALGARQGASTITQQVVKNILLTHKRKFKRKIKEAILAYRVEQALTKREILTIYANAIYFGNGCYGIAEAARFYFGKTLEDLDIGQMAYLAGLVKNPGGYALNRHPEKAKQRQKYVLQRLRELDYINPEEFDQALATPLVFSPPDDKGPEAGYVLDEIKRRLTAQLGQDRLEKGGLRIYTRIQSDLQIAAQHAVRSNLLAYERRHAYRPMVLLNEEEKNIWQAEVKRIGKRNRKSDGDIFAFSADHPAGELKGFADTPIWHTVVRRISADGLYFGYVTQSTASEATVSLGNKTGKISKKDIKWITQTGKSALSDGRIVVVQLDGNLRAEIDTPLSLTLAQIPDAQSALVAVNPKTRDVVAMTGGFSPWTAPFNRATQAQRQPGSSFKPFVYLTALSKGIVTPATIIEDKPISYPTGSGRSWSPGNFDGKFRGPLRLREGLAKSINTVAVQTLDKVGIYPVIRTAKRFGISSPLIPNLTLALGSSEVTLWELTNAYAVFAAEGLWDTLRLVDHVIGPEGKTLWRHRAKPKTIISKTQAALMTSLLESVVEFGTSQRAKTLGRPVAGKTGTTNNQRDAWFVGFSPDLVAGVWVGYDDDRVLGRGETGARAALPAWISFMREALKDKPIRSFPETGLVHEWVNGETGLRADPGQLGAIEEVFLPQYLPLDGDSEIQKD